MQEKKLWFKAKLYGWGWAPASWQGWTILALYLFGAISLSLEIDRNTHSAKDALIDFSPEFIGMTVLLIVICYLTGEKPRWRWGK